MDDKTNVRLGILANIMKAHRMAVSINGDTIVCAKAWRDRWADIGIIVPVIETF